MLTITKRITDTIPSETSIKQLKSDHGQKLCHASASDRLVVWCTAVVHFIVFLVQAVAIILEALGNLIVPPYEKDLFDEIVLITGSGHGIGRELALKFAQEGCTIVCWDINEDANKETVRILQKMGFDNVHAYKCDVSVREDVMRVADRVESEVGKVTVLVNNAGIMPCLHLESHTPNLIRRVFDINIMAHFWTLEAFLPSMKRRNFGHVVAISSMCGISGLPNAVAYSSTKFAVRGMMEALSEEMRIADKQIKFTTVYPFTVDTGLVKKPRNRFPSLLNILQPDEVAGQVVKAVRQDIKEISVPASLLKTDNLIRLLPSRLVHHMRDFLDTGVDPEE